MTIFKKDKPKRKWLSKGFRIAVGFVLTALALFNSVGWLHSDVVDRLDYLLYDVRLRADAKMNEPDPRVVIVDIDEKSLKEIGRWPWSRDIVGELVVKLTDKLGASVVAFDVVFAEAQASDAMAALDVLADKEPSLAPRLAGWRGNLEKVFDRDAQFAEIIASRPVVLGYYLNQDPNALSGALPKALFKRSQLGDMKLDSTVWQGYGANIPVLQRRAEAGFFNPIVDDDGTVRSIPLLAQFGEAYYQSLALATLRRAMGNPQLIPVFPENVGPDYGAVDSLVLSKGDVHKTIQLERGLISRVQFRGKGGPQGGGYRYVSASDVLAGNVDANLIKDRMVLVGTTAPGLLDLRSTPVNPTFPGVEVHANVISSMLDEQYLLKPEYSQGILFVFVLVLGGVLSLLMPILSPVWSLVVALFVLGGSIAFNSFGFFYGGLVIPVAALLLLVVAIFMFNVAYGFLAESRSKRQMVSLFGEYVAPELVSEMADDPARYSMEGESRELTVLFSDVRGFTTISESLEPNELREYINEYLTCMSEIIREHRGTLDKYIGDAIMAFWGAPIPDAEHARLATEAAVHMQAQAIRLNERFVARGWPKLAIGVGVNTGVMRVGDMGSKIRRAYTVMGDAVNLGARLEGITKTYGVGVIVGPNTKNVVDAWVFQELDAVRVKGKNEPVLIYAPIVLKNIATSSINQDAHEKAMQRVERWHEVLAAFRSQRWAEALAGLDALEAQFGPAELYVLYRERIAHFMHNPPPADWDGVTQFETK